MTDLVTDLKKVVDLNGDTYSSYEVIGLLRRAAGEIDRLMRCINMAMGCIDPDSKNRDEALAWYRLYDAEIGREPRPSLDQH